MLPIVSNLFSPRPPGETTEQFVPLLETPDFRLEYIVSHGQTTEADFWYDQPNPEWVLLIRGQAQLRFEGTEVLALKAGDYLLIPAHSRHSIESCSDDALWLALHFRTETP
jgi:cupin 2 domain-containing protein